MDTAESTITQAEYLQLLGLMMLIQKHQLLIDDLETAARTIVRETGEPGDGWVSGAMYYPGVSTPGDAVAGILKGHKITVAEEA